MNTPNKQKIKDNMLDTVALRIRYPDFKVSNPNLFTPAFDIQKLSQDSYFSFGFNRYKTFKQNPTLHDKQLEDYKPRLTGYMRCDDENKPYFDLIVEFSIPKLLFKQSLQELSNSDFERVISTLKFQLQKMSVVLTDNAIRQAIVTKAHFGKNIPLQSPITSQDAISELYKADIGRGKHISIRHYENGGQALYFYSSSYQVVFYDKLRDIATPKNKAVDKDKFKQERMIVESRAHNQELLRFEARLAKQQKLNAFISDIIGKKVKAITFEEIFNKDLCRKVMLKVWSEITKNPASQLALKIDSPADEIFDAIIKSYIEIGKKKAHSLNKALQDFAIYTLVNRCGSRKFRDKIEKNWTPKSWQRLSFKIKRTAGILKELAPSHVISDIQITVEKFDKYDWQV
ncbi:MAG: hypothetical protein ABR875_01110 [Minisyncoccia bacterium]|jgi:hypothetical protein